MFKIYNNLESRLKRLYGKDPTNDSWHYMRENRLPYIQMFHDDSEESEVDDITWNDLDMDNVFFRINHTQSFLGNRYFIIVYIIQIQKETGIYLRRK